MKQVQGSREEILKSIEVTLSEGDGSVEQQLCKHCGKARESVEALFWLYGSSDEFRVQLPICACGLEATQSAKKPETQSNQAVAGTQSVGHWRDLYRIAVFEEDARKLPARIDAAEESLLMRARELFHADSKNISERLEVDAALYALYALKSASMSVKAKRDANFPPQKAS